MFDFLLTDCTNRGQADGVDNQSICMYFGITDEDQEDLNNVSLYGKCIL